MIRNSSQFLELECLCAYCRQIVLQREQARMDSYPSTLPEPLRRSWRVEAQYIRQKNNFLIDITGSGSPNGPIKWKTGFHSHIISTFSVSSQWFLRNYKAIKRREKYSCGDIFWNTFLNCWKTEFLSLLYRNQNSDLQRFTYSYKIKSTQD